MGRLTAVPFRPYRLHQLEIRDDGRRGCAVIIHPPGGRGAPHEVSSDAHTVALVDLINQAKAMIDTVMGALPPMASRGGQSVRSDC